MKIEIKVKKIHTVIPFFYDGVEINRNDVRSFITFREAEDYGYTLQYSYDIIENDIEI